MKRTGGRAWTAVSKRAAAISLILLSTGCRFLAAESDWEPFDDARDLCARKQITWNISAVLMTDGQIIDFVHGLRRDPRFAEQGIAWRAMEGVSTEITLERGRIKGVMIAHYEWYMPPIPVLPGAGFPAFR